MTQTSEKIFTTRFNLLCLSSLLFFCSFNMIIPELYSFVEDFDGASAKKFIIIPFTVVALLSRPISGKLVDSIGRVPVMIFGSSIACIASLFYPWVTTVSFFIALRAFHGLATGFKPTGSSTIIADIIPKNKRGQAMGYLGFMGSTGMALGPWMGSTINTNWGYQPMFFASSFIAFLSIIVILNIKDTLPPSEKKPFNLELLKVKWNEILDKKVWLPSLIFLLYCLAYGTVYNLSSDMGKKIFHIENVGWYFLWMVLASMFSRLIAGKISDKKGRLPVVLFGLLILEIALFVFTLTVTKDLFYFSGVIFGLAVGILSPSIYAWVADLSSKKEKGKSFSTMYMAMELGIGVGAFISSLIFNDIIPNMYLAFKIALIFPAIGILILLYVRHKNYNFVR